MATQDSGSTAGRLIDEARQLIMLRGYNGFSYADLAAAIGIRKPSIHFHFPAKADLVRAVIEQSRQGIRAQSALLDEASPDPLRHLHGYVDYWRNCIGDNSAPFCLAGVLATELPGLPVEVGQAVRGHFEDLTHWIARVLELGAAAGAFRLDHSPAREADAFLAVTYGAMLSARAFGAPDKFAAITDLALERLTGRGQGSGLSRS